MFKLQYNFSCIAITIPELQMYKLDLEKAGEPEIKSPDLLDHGESKETPEKNLL